MADFGLIGHPVSHSMSRIMHEAAFNHLGLNYNYSLFDVKEDEVGLFFDNMKFMGLNVTVPLKVAVLPLMSSLSDEARLIGAVNTVESKDGFIGHNTDSLGFITCLEESKIDVAGRDFLVLGAGGAARAITFKLAMEKARVKLLARNRQKAESLAQDVNIRLGVKVAVADSILNAMAKADVVVNATSVGMLPNIDDTLVPKELLSPSQTVIDIVYNPLQTRLLREAKDRGCTTVDGVGMLLHQGAQALRIWLNVTPPVDVMRKAVLDSLRNQA